MDEEACPAFALIHQDPTSVCEWKAQGVRNTLAATGQLKGTQCNVLHYWLIQGEQASTNVAAQAREAMILYIHIHGPSWPSYRKKRNELDIYRY